MANNTVVNDVRLRMLLVSGRSVPVDASLSYRDSSPYEVEAVFHTLAGDITWTFARDLLSEGLRDQAGLGDISIWPDTTPAGQSVVYLSLVSPNGQALLEADRADIEGFVQRIFAAVPAGSEAELLNMDFVLDMLLDEDQDDFLGGVVDQESLDASMRRHPSRATRVEHPTGLDFGTEFDKIAAELDADFGQQPEDDDDQPMAA